VGLAVVQLVQQAPDTALDLVADGPHLIEGEPGGVGKVPVKIALAG